MTLGPSGRLATRSSGASAPGRYRCEPARGPPDRPLHLRRLLYHTEITDTYIDSHVSDALAQHLDT
ncbi:MAG: hypothetical protein QGD89_04265 [Actinomycetota bacterium]|nr:hypothetical protein [Actinomycetota bacterium]